MNLTNITISQQLGEISPIQGVDRLAAVIIFLTSFIGMLINGFIAYNIKNVAMLKNSFGRLLQLQATGDMIFLGVWAVYFAPVLLLDYEPFQILMISSRFGQICLICYDISIYTHLIISVNRFISLYFPTYYNSIFTDLVTTILIVSIVLVSIVFSFFLIHVNCVMGFSRARWMLDYVSPPCNMTNVYLSEVLRGLLIISMFALINCLTYFRMHLHNNNNNRKTPPMLVKRETIQQKRRRLIEKSFIQQVTTQGIVYVMELISYFYLADFFPVDNKNVENDPNRWPNFLLTTFAWILVHTLDGVITIVYNKSFRKIFKSFAHDRFISVRDSPSFSMFSRRPTVMTRTGEVTALRSSVIICTTNTGSGASAGSNNYSSVLL